MKFEHEFISLLFGLIFLTGSVSALDAKIWTDKQVYAEGDYVKIYIQLPREKFSSCETHLIDPSGNEITTGSGGCVAGINEIQHMGAQPEEKYNESGKLEEFVSSLISNGVENGRLGDKFGKWGVKVLAKKEDGMISTLTTDFEYKYFNSIVGFCKLENEKTTTCNFLGSPFEVTRRGDGCGPNPVDIQISYFGGVKKFQIAQGDEADLDMGLISVTNIGSPCAVDSLSLRFNKAILPEETYISASVSDKKIDAKIDGELKSFSLPQDDKVKIIDARVAGEEGLKKLSIDVDNKKNVLLLESGGVAAETNLSLSIENTKLQAESKGEKFDINILPDTALEKFGLKLDSIESFEIQSGSAIYFIKGSKNVKILGLVPIELTLESKIDATTGVVKSIEKPWWSFLAF